MRYFGGKKAVFLEFTTLVGATLRFSLTIDQRVVGRHQAAEDAVVDLFVEKIAVPVAVYDVDAAGVKTGRAGESIRSVALAHLAVDR